MQTPRRIATTLATLAAAAMLALAVPSSAYAANGVLIINGEGHVDPSGCYPSNIWPLAVANHTDEVAFVFDGPDCDGKLVEIIHRHESTVSEYGGSVYIS